MLGPLALWSGTRDYLIYVSAYYLIRCGLICFSFSFRIFYLLLLGWGQNGWTRAIFRLEQKSTQTSHDKIRWTRQGTG